MQQTLENAMRLEMKQGSVKLGPNQTLRVVDGSGSVEETDALIRAQVEPVMAGA